MHKIVLSLIVVVVASLIVACSNEDNIKADDVLQYELSVASDNTKSVSKTVKFPIYILDKNISTVKYLPIDSNLSVDDKVNIIADTMSAVCFNNLPIDVNVQGKKASVNLRESEESRKTWKDDFLDEHNFEDTTLLIVKNLLQEDYEGEWIDTVQIAYEGEDIN